MFEHHASHVIMELSHRLRRAAVEADPLMLKKWRDLLIDVEAAFPEARDEVNRIYRTPPRTED